MSGVSAQSVSFSATYATLRVSVSQSSPQSPPAGTESSRPVTDSVELSPAAVTPETGVSAATTGSSTPSPEVAGNEVVAGPLAEADTTSGSPATRKADALLAALDADKNGSISEQEFTEGAMALLRRAGSRHHHRRVHGDGHDHGRHHARRLEHRLERLFDRLDANGDGAVDGGELSAALTPSAPAPAATSVPKVPETITTTSVTIVAVAIQRYAAISS
jgi:hypothetical protein